MKGQTTRSMSAPGETGHLMFTVIGAIACFERELMLERQREGIAKAKPRENKRDGNPPARARAAEVNALKADGVRPVEIAARQLRARYRCRGIESDHDRHGFV